MDEVSQNCCLRQREKYCRIPPQISRLYFWESFWEMSSFLICTSSTITTEGRNEKGRERIKEGEGKLREIHPSAEAKHSVSPNESFFSGHPWSEGGKARKREKSLGDCERRRRRQLRERRKREARLFQLPFPPIGGGGRRKQLLLSLASGSRGRRLCGGRREREIQRTVALICLKTVIFFREVF